ncbi:hypothetical protein B0T21DRAFT_348504 [Apiosordaria backusii]|uniref:Uncharacterized protein n=1 Tax=Apiosordaria backusii TaxID=314023 RepID=A0AA40BLN6_9PEZI|nr:hypothetical protein B0T21DRAFT_348504 [Apiosordaria backusii]
MRRREALMVLVGGGGGGGLWRHFWKRQEGQEQGGAPQLPGNLGKGHQLVLGAGCSGTFKNGCKVRCKPSEPGAQSVNGGAPPSRAAVREAGCRSQNWKGFVGQGKASAAFIALLLESAV